MVSARTATAVVGVVASLLASLLVWWYFGTFVFFLFVPFVPFLFRRSGSPDRPEARTCPACGYRTRNDDHEFCPRDGRRLE